MVEFTLEHWPAAMLALGPAVLSLALLAYIVLRLPRTGTIYLFAGFIGALTVWQFSDALVRLSPTAGDARLWGNLLGLGALLIGPLGFHFALLYTGHEAVARSPALVSFLYLPPLAIEAATRAGFNPVTLVSHPFWGWVSTASTPPVNQAYGVWVAGLAIGVVALLFAYAGSRPPGHPDRGPAYVVAAGFSAPVLQGAVTQVLFPVAFGVEPLPMASTTMVVFTVATVYALRRQQFLRASSTQAELALTRERLARERLALADAQRLAHMGSWEWDLRTNRVEWSDEMFRIYGHAPRAFEVDFDRAMTQVRAEDAAAVQANLERSFVAARAAFDERGERDVAVPALEYRIRRPDGSEPVLRGEARLQMDPKGEPARMVGTVQDVTRSHEVEDSRRLAYERDQEIRRLQEMNEFKTRFINSAAHELNTPLTPIRLQLHLIKGMKGFDASNPELGRSLQILERNVDRLTHLVQDVLDATRLQTDRLRLNPKEVDLAEIVQEAVDSFREAARNAGLNVQIRGTRRLRVHADPLRLTQVLYILLTNAIKFTPAGGTVTVEAIDGPEGATVRVRDTGIGIRPDAVGKLFQPFVQLHDPAAVSGPGTGLGLYIAKGIAEAHRGEIRCESEGPGQGTTFVLRIPVAEPKPAGPSVQRRETAPKPSSRLEERIRRML